MFFGSVALAVALAVTPSDRMPPPAPASRVYVQPAFVFLIQPASTQAGFGPYRVSFISPNLSGHAPGVMVSAGGFLSRWVGLEGEVVYGGTVSKAQQHTYQVTLTGPVDHVEYTAKNRDLLFNELVRIRPRPGIEIVGGGGYARTTAQKIGTRVFPSFVLLNSPTLTGGVDLTLRVAQGFVLTPSLRFRWVRRRSPPHNGWNGVSPYAIQFGLGVRLR